MRALVTMAVIAAYFSLTGCATLNDGFAAMRGEGGTIARVDGYPYAIASARRLPPQPAPLWYGDFPHESADFIEFVDAERVLIGTVEVDGYLGTPRHGEVVLYDARTGRSLWSASRPALSDGEYRVLSVAPHVLVLGSDPLSLHLLAIERDTGAIRWSLDRAMPTRMVADRAHMHLLVTRKSETETGYMLETVDLASGKLLAQHHLDATLIEPVEPQLHALEQDFIVAGRRLARISRKNGDVIWDAASSILERGGATVEVIPQGVLVHDAGGAALHSASDGRILWDLTIDDGGIKLVADVGEDRLALVHGGNGGDALRLLRARDGRRLWEREIGASIASPIAVVNDSLVFTTDIDLMAVRASDGRPRVTAALPADFRMGSPRYAGAVGQPDVLHLERGRLYIARERAGVIAFALRDGRALWHQLLREPHSGASPYSVLARQAELNLWLQHHRHLFGASAAPAAVAHPQSNSPGARLMLQSAQYQYDRARQGRGSLLHAVQQQEIALQMDAFNQQMATTQALFGALMSLNVALAQALQMEAVQGVISRKTMELRAALRLHGNSFQGGYHLSPFETEDGFGVTLIELGSGKRSDLFVTPRILRELPSDFLVGGLGMRLPTFRLSPAGGQLLLVGNGLEPMRFRPYVKWKFRLPRPALLSYDLGDMTFRAVDPQVAAERERGMRQFRQEVPLLLVNFAGSGDINQVEFLLDAGADVNSSYPSGETALMAAAFSGHEQIVKLLLARGADAGRTNDEGKRAADLARTPEIAELLADAVRSAHTK